MKSSPFAITASTHAREADNFRVHDEKDEQFITPNLAPFYVYHVAAWFRAFKSLWQQCGLALLEIGVSALVILLPWSLSLLMQPLQHWLLDRQNGSVYIFFEPKVSPKVVESLR